MKLGSTQPILRPAPRVCDTPVLLAHRPAAGKAEALAQPQHGFEAIERRLRAILGSLDPDQWLATTLRSMRRIVGGGADGTAGPSLLAVTSEPAATPRSRSAARA